MNVSQVMSRRLVTVSPNASFRDLWRSIFKHKVNALPVVDKKKNLLGIVTRERLLERVYPDYGDLFAGGDLFPDFEDIEAKLGERVSMKAKDVMSPWVIYTQVDTPILRALSRMIVRHVNQLPVVSAGGTLVGMVTKGDIFYILFRRHFAKKGKRAR